MRFLEWIWSNERDQLERLTHFPVLSFIFLICKCLSKDNVDWPSWTGYSKFSKVKVLGLIQSELDLSWTAFWKLSFFSRDFSIGKVVKVLRAALTIATVAEIIPAMTQILVFKFVTKITLPSFRNPSDVLLGNQSIWSACNDGFKK